MIAEPYICTKGPRVGEIVWWDRSGFDKKPDQKVWTSSPECSTGYYEWMAYADFERERLKVLCCFPRELKVSPGGYTLAVPKQRNGVWSVRPVVEYESSMLIGYHLSDYNNDSESSRLLKRMEFLREVCKREGVSWLPEVCDTCGKPL